LHTPCHRLRWNLEVNYLPQWYHWMSNYTSPQLVPPPQEEDVYAYRPVWRSIAIENGILLVVTSAIFVLFDFLGLDFPEAARIPVNVILALLPTLLWLLFSRLPENTAPTPRPRLFTTFVVSALVANAVGIPVIEDLLQPDVWLAQATTVQRIIGFATTTAVVQEFLKFLVLRSLIWPDYIRVRGDSIAYGVAGAIGYATVLNLYTLFVTPDISVDALALRVLTFTTIHIATSVIIAYGLSETLLNDANALLLPVMLTVAVFYAGIVWAMRTSFMNAAVGITVSAQRGIFGLAFLLVMYLAPIIIMNFLFQVAENRQRDKNTSEA